MKREIMMMAAVVAAGAAMAAEPAATATVTVDMKAELGPVKLMNSVNNGPSVKNPAGAHLAATYTGAPHNTKVVVVPVATPEGRGGEFTGRSSRNGMPRCGRRLRR